MERTRFRFVGLIEWLIAAACLVAGLVLIAALSGDFPHVSPVMPVMAGAATAPIVPANVPSGSISVPELVLPDGKTLTVGSPVATLAFLGPLALTGPISVDRTASEERESRTYRYAGMEFVVVTADGVILAIYR